MCNLVDLDIDGLHMHHINSFDVTLKEYYMELIKTYTKGQITNEGMGK